jgi:hypothetical protein
MPGRTNPPFWRVSTDAPLDGHEHLGKRHARPGVDNDRLDRRAVGRADRILRRGIPGQRSRTTISFVIAWTIP